MKHAVIKSTFFVVVATVLLRSLGFIREMSLAAAYGAGMITDAFVVAYTVPNVMLAFISSSVAAVYIPVYQINKEHKDLYTSNIVNILLIIGLTFSLIFSFFPQALVYLFASQLEAGTFALAVMMTRIMVWTAVPVLVWNIFKSYLEIKGAFFAANIVYAAVNICVIVSIFLSRETDYLPLLGIGAVLGNILSIIFIYAACHKHGLRYRPYFNLNESSIKEMLILIAPVIIATGINEINQIADRNFASTLPAGSISSLNYASKLIVLATMLIGAAVAAVLFPKMSELASKKDFDSLKKYMTGCIVKFIPVLLPLTAGTIILALPLTRILFQHGAFAADDTLRTAECLQMYAICITCNSIGILLLRVLHSMKNMKAPAVCSGIAVAFNIGLNFLLVDSLGHIGLAFATGIASAVSMSLLLFTLKREFGSLGFASEVLELAKAILATLVMSVAVGAGNAFLPVMSGNDAQCTALTVALVLAGVFIYALMHAMLRTGFWFESMQLMKTALKRIN